VETSPMVVALSMEDLLEVSAWCSTVRASDVRPVAPTATYIAGEIADVSGLLASA